MRDVRVLSFRDDRPPRWRASAEWRPTDVLWAWLVATLFSGLPSTLHAFFTRADPLEATRAAAAMWGGAAGDLPHVLFNAALVHGGVSFFWAVVLSTLLPARWTVWWAVAAAAVIALIDLKLIAPVFFPAVAALAFGPQLLDHLMWGLCLGLTLELRRRRRSRERNIFR